jgi:hypothetical protein
MELYLAIGAAAGALVSFVITFFAMRAKYTKLLNKNVEKQNVAKKEVVISSDTSVEVGEDEKAVAFAADKTQTLEEKIALLDAENKKYYNEIADYASTVADVKRFKNNRYEEYKVGSYRVVRMSIKRGVILCEFMMHNSDFKNYVAQNKVSVKHSATSIKVVNEETVKAIKDSINIVVENIGIEKEFKKQLAREKRKAKRQQDKA